ncbi:hypothetical protein [Tatumella citrea]|uniref:hypothetical protein n=1 Tax=Tatumella citrea TaxID=53336 RepID=UPI0012F87F37|nr:hypothetical protein [Tatumella citrea]
MTLTLVTDEISFATNIRNRAVFMHQVKIPVPGNRKMLFAQSLVTGFRQFISSVHL